MLMAHGTSEKGERAEGSLSPSTPVTDLKQDQDVAQNTASVSNLKQVIDYTDNSTAICILPTPVLWRNIGRCVSHHRRHHQCNRSRHPISFDGNPLW